MKKKNAVTQLEDFKLNTRLKAIGLWVSLMLLYIYADIFSFYRTGYIGEVVAGFIGKLEVSQITLVSSGVLMVVPVLVIIVCLFAKAKAVRWVNMIAGTLYTIVGIGNLVGETWIYYWIYGIIEIFVTIFIMVIALNWSKKAESET
jgi:hypothetical protein